MKKQDKFDDISDLQLFIFCGVIIGIYALTFYVFIGSITNVVGF